LGELVELSKGFAALASQCLSLIQHRGDLLLFI